MGIPLMIFLDWDFFPNPEKWFVASVWVGAFICAGSVIKDLCVALLGAHMTYITMALEIAVVFVEICWLAPRSVGMHEIFLLVLILQEVLLHNAQTYDFDKQAALTRYDTISELVQQMSSVDVEIENSDRAALERDV